MDDELEAAREAALVEVWEQNHPGWVWDGDDPPAPTVKYTAADGRHGGMVVLHPDCFRWVAGPIVDGVLVLVTRGHEDRTDADQAVTFEKCLAAVERVAQ